MNTIETKMALKINSKEQRFWKRTFRDLIFPEDRALVEPVFMEQRQTSLFDWQTLKFAHLVAVDHPRPVYYDIWLEKRMGRYQVKKSSGIVGRKPNVWRWEFYNLTDAEKEFERRIKQKTNIKRRSPRIYKEHHRMNMGNHFACSSPDFRIFDSREQHFSTGLFYNFKERVFFHLARGSA